MRAGMRTIPLRPAAPPRVPAGPGAWSAARLLSAPHRLAFFAGALVLALSSLWWLAGLLALQSGWAWPWAVPPGLAHGLLFSAGFMPLFIAGFLFTAGPRWLGLPEQPAPALLMPLLQFGAGWLLAVVGFHLHGNLAAAGLMAVALAWLRLVLRFAGLVRSSAAADRLHARAVTLACAVGAVLLMLASLATWGGHWAGLRAATQLLVWAFMGPVFCVVAHRMIPFFTAAALPFLDAWRPTWLLGAMAGALLLGAVDAVLVALDGSLPPWLRGVLGAFALAAGLLLLALALRWGLLQSWRNRLLAMLHGGFVWLGIALALVGLSQGRQALGLSGLGLAPLHAMTLGYLGCTLIAMATRVAAGHSGRPLAVDGRAWALYLLLQATVLSRLLTELWPSALLPAAVGWAVVACAWALRHGLWFGRPRVDGRPG
jgi:uncharacterized protein involved in response to NO